MADWERKVRVLGTLVHVIDLQTAVQVLVDWVVDARRQRSDGALPPCRYVVTPNLDHAVMLRSNPAFREAYAGAALVLADGMPLVWMSRLLGYPLPGRVPGSDLVPQLLGACPPDTGVYLLGASEESSLGAREAIQERYPQLRVVGRMSPPFGFEHSKEWSEKITSDIRATEAEVVIVGLGAPKQEVWVSRHAELLPGTTILCAGATIDFLSGFVRRAPPWAQRTGLEWVHRMISDPKRLVRRYAKDAAYVPLLVMEDARARFGPKRQG